MNLSIWIKLKNLVAYLISTVILKIITAGKRDIQKNTLLLIRLDAIGDYVLLRNFIRFIKSTKKYSDFKVTLCGNIVWRDLAETFDIDCIDKFIWLDRNKFKSGIKYKYNFLKNIYYSGFDTTIDLTFSREILFGDTIVGASKSNERIGSKGSPDSYVKWKRSIFSNNYYTKLIPVRSENIFEFYRNKEFFELVTGEELRIYTTSIDFNKPRLDFDLPVNYAVLFPGANEEKRKWNINCFADIAELLISNYNLNVVVAGSEMERGLSEKLSATFGKDILDLAGKTTLNQLVKIIGQAKLLVSNETGAVHIAASTKTAFICISNGNHFGRFHPYPEEIFDKAYYVYPEEIEKNLGNQVILNKYRFGSELDINLISAERVKQKINEILSN